jgi:hypothetical protein
VLRTVLQRVSELSTIINTMVDNDDYVELEGVMGPEFPELCDKFNDCVFIGHLYASLKIGFSLQKIPLVISCV